MSNQPLLSILIPTLPERKATTALLRARIAHQVTEFHCTLEDATNYQVEILYDDSPRFLAGGLSIGKKREALIKAATGKYVCFVDDDDTVFDGYIKGILEKLIHDADAVTFDALYVGGAFYCRINMDHNNPVNEQVSQNATVRRTIWHICPIRASIAKSVPWDDINFDEDWQWLKKIIPLIKTSHHIDMTLYQYNESRNSEAQKINKEGFK
jgi:glycosyltransferase involved in cell wall biosynthesis